jgi:hypothetical protein
VTGAGGFEDARLMMLATRVENAVLVQVYDK